MRDCQWINGADGLLCSNCGYIQHGNDAKLLHNCPALSDFTQADHLAARLESRRLNGISTAAATEIERRLAICTPCPNFLGAGCKRCGSCSDCSEVFIKRLDAEGGTCPDDDKWQVPKEVPDGETDTTDAATEAEAVPPLQGG